jgi:hypothetical protein
MKTILSLQQWLKAEGFDPGPIDGADGPNTFAAWSHYLEAIGQAANGASNTIESLQCWLKAEGFDPGPIDGADGPNTFKAWSDYQAANGASSPSKDLGGFGATAGVGAGASRPGGMGGGGRAGAGVAGLGGAGMGAPGGLGGGGRGKVSPGALKARLEEIVSASPLVGFLPSDGPRYGITTGAAHEWAQMFTDLAKVESGFNPRDATVDARERAISGGAGSHGLFSLSPQDATNYGLQSSPFTYDQLYDPDTNARAAVAIASKLIEKYGTISGGMGKYWGPIKRGAFHPGTSQGSVASAAGGGGAVV